MHAGLASSASRLLVRPKPSATAYPNAQICTECGLIRDSPVDVVRLLIVDDHAEVRKAIRRLVTVENWEVCGEAGDGDGAIQAARQLKPDVIIMDLFMPGMTGIQAAAEIRKEFPAMLIMLVTTLDARIEEAARKVGIRGTVSKMATDQIVRGIQAMLRGEEFHQLRDKPDRPA
jgi:DNA-binding NarL/FixJ family response regulator